MQKEIVNSLLNYLDWRFTVLIAIHVHESIWNVTSYKPRKSLGFFRNELIMKYFFGLSINVTEILVNVFLRLNHNGVVVFFINLFCVRTNRWFDMEINMQKSNQIRKKKLQAIPPKSTRKSQ